VGTREDQLGCRTNHDYAGIINKNKKKGRKLLPTFIIPKYAFCDPIKKPEEYRKKKGHIHSIN